MFPANAAASANLNQGAADLGWAPLPFQPSAVPKPLMAPNYVYDTPEGLRFTEAWNSSSVTDACYANPDKLARCMDAVVRGGLSLLTPVVGTSGAPETLLPEEAAFLAAALGNPALSMFRM